MMSGKLCALLLLGCTASSIYNQVYTDLTQGSPCVRLLNNTGMIGCSTPDLGLAGTLRMATTQAQLDALLASKPTDLTALLLSQAVFTRENTVTLGKTLQLAGIMVAHQSEQPTGAWSPAESRPQAWWRLGSNESATQYKWNPAGSGLNLDAFPHAIVALSRLESEVLLQRAGENEAAVAAGNFPNQAVQFQYHMFAEQTSKDCLDAATCMPLGGYSVWAAVGDGLNTSEPDRGIVFATARMDGNAFIHDLATGANSAMTGLVVLLAAAARLAQVAEVETLPRQLVFAALHGEAWGFLGSRKFVDDLTNFKCRELEGTACKEPFKPDLQFQGLNLSKIESYVELNQLGLNSTVFVHRERDSNNGTDMLVQTLRDAAGPLGASVEAASGDTPGVPPSSAIAFLKARGDIPAVVLTDHAGAYTNEYFESRFDDSEYVLAAQGQRVEVLLKNEEGNLQPVPALPNLCQTATLTARTLYLAAGGPERNTTGRMGADEISVDCDKVAELFHCLTVDFHCALVCFFTGCTPGTSAQDAARPSHYTSVYNLMQRHYVTGTSRFVRDYLALALKNTTSKDTVPPAVYYHDAVDPDLVFDYKRSMWGVKANSTSPLWTESNWGADIGARSYVREHPAMEWVMLGSGLVVLVTSILSLHCCRKLCIRKFKRI